MKAGNHCQHHVCTSLCCSMKMANTNNSKMYAVGENTASIHHLLGCSTCSYIPSASSATAAAPRAGPARWTQEVISLANHCQPVEEGRQRSQPIWGTGGTGTAIIELHFGNSVSSTSFRGWQWAGRPPRRQPLNPTHWRNALNGWGAAPAWGENRLYCGERSRRVGRGRMQEGRTSAKSSGWNMCLRITTRGFSSPTSCQLNRPFWLRAALSQFCPTSEML